VLLGYGLVEVDDIERGVRGLADVRQVRRSVAREHERRTTAR
jgi:hypothetical protein